MFGLGEASRPRGAPGPVAPTERIVLVDILRGTALFGILLVNYNKAAAPVVSEADRAVQTAIEFFCDGSFFPLFSFLFGVGFALQVGRLESRGAGVVTTYLRRLAVLLAFGLLHSVLLASGEVLRYYAILGVPLLLIRRLPSWMLLCGVALCLLLTVKLDWATSLVDQVSAVVPWTAPAGPTERAEARQLEVAELRALEGSYGEQVRIRAQMVWQGIRHFSLIAMYPIIFGMFLLGLLASRQGWLAHPLDHRAFLRRAMIAGLMVGLLGSFLSMLGPAVRSRGFDIVPQRVLDFRGALELAGNLGLSLFYGTAVTLVVSEREEWCRRLTPIGLVGRMGLTNFLTQSVVMLLVMSSFGLGLAFKVGLAALVPLKLTLFAGQIGLSRWWMRRFRFGPAEWLWRAATYGSLPTMLTHTRHERAG